ncbi:hypothetical protein [Paraburkholderia caribensis]|uniref:hypothetical protein n=1 Tax=Paraburkholderia caribensis TaxID=75105 RepID=UPI0034D29DC4
MTIYVRAGCEHCGDIERRLKEQGHEVRKISIAGAGSVMAIGSGLSGDTHPVVFAGSRRIDYRAILQID